MKVGFALFSVVFVLFAATTFAQSSPMEEFSHGKGREVLINLQGENHDFWVISFYQDGDNHADVKQQITDAMSAKFPDEKFKYGEVDLNAGYEYQELFETLDLVGEPKRGRSTPQVLVMKDGEGYIIYGPNIGEGVAKRYAEVRDGTVFQSTTNPTTRR